MAVDTHRLADEQREPSLRVRAQRGELTRNVMIEQRIRTIETALVRLEYEDDVIEHLVRRVTSAGLSDGAWTQLEQFDVSGRVVLGDRSGECRVVAVHGLFSQCKTEHRAGRIVLAVPRVHVRAVRVGVGELAGVARDEPLVADVHQTERVVLRVSGSDRDLARLRSRVGEERSAVVTARARHDPGLTGASGGVGLGGEMLGDRTPYF